MRKPHVLTPDQYLSREASHLGLCLRCDSWIGETDPGAARAKCCSCGNYTVHGVEQALLLGAV